MQKWSVNTDVYFGQGALDRLGEIKGKKVLIVTDAFMNKSGTAQMVASHMPQSEVKIFDEVVPEPPLNVVAAGVSVLTSFDADLIVALGGGSSIDAAKAIRSVAQAATQSDKTIPLIAVPTTSGTGSEVTDYAVITNPAQGVKYPLADPALAASEAILDPVLTTSVPQAITADTGLDALTHAVEAYVSTGANDFTDAWAEKAIELIFEYLPRAYADGSDLEARAKMSNAATLAGFAFNQAGLGCNHGIAHAVGARFHLPHGRACQLLLPLVIEFNSELDHVRNGQYSRAAKKYAHLAKILGYSSASVRLGATNFMREVDKLCRSCGEPATLKQCGVDASDARAQAADIAKMAVADPTTANNPRSVSEQDVLTIYKKLMG